MEDISNIVLQWFLNPIKPAVKLLLGVKLACLSPCFDGTQSSSWTNKLVALLLTAPVQREVVKTILSKGISLSLSIWQILSGCFCHCLQNGWGLVVFFPCNKLLQLATYLPFSCFPPQYKHCFALPRRPLCFSLVRVCLSFYTWQISSITITLSVFVTASSLFCFAIAEDTIRTVWCIFATRKIRCPSQGI